MSTATTSFETHHHTHWYPGFGAKVVLVLIAILVFSLAATGLEARLGALPSDPAISWDFGGE